MMLYVLLTFTITLVSQVPPTVSPRTASCGGSYFWVDRRCHERRHKSAKIDTFFDRTVAIVSRIGQTRKVLGSGVLITRHLVLTSHNAFKTLALDKDTMKLVHFIVPFSRRFSTAGQLLHYKVTVPMYKMVCGRQVIMREKNETVPSHMRHGSHSPIHDLMVMRIDRPINFLNFTRKFSFPDYAEGEWIEEDNNYEVLMGPIQTDLARPHDILEVYDIKFVSLGHLDDEHIKVYRFLELDRISEGDTVMANCDEWIPREWGHFICLRNDKDYAGIASGGMLFSGEKLFGVGSFALWKRAQGILVFTDVRPYWHLMYRTCTVSDQKLVIPKS